MPKKLIKYQNGNFVIDMKRREIDFCMPANQYRLMKFHTYLIYFLFKMLMKC